MGTMGEQKFVHMTFGHMTKMDAMPIYDKNPSKIFSETSMPISLNLVYSISDSGPANFVQMRTLAWP